MISFTIHVRKWVDFVKLIPTGIENFKEIFDKNYYYVDKTNLIQDILNEKLFYIQDLEDLGKH